MAVPAMEREVDLPQRRFAKNFMTRLMQQRSVRRQVHLKPSVMTDVEQLVDLRMQQRLAFDMEIDMVGERLDFVQNMREFVYLYESSFALRRRTERAR